MKFGGPSKGDYKVCLPGFDAMQFGKCLPTLCRDVPSTLAVLLYRERLQFVTDYNASLCGVPCISWTELSANKLLRTFSIKRGEFGGDCKKTCKFDLYNPYPTAFPYGNGMVLHFYQQQESSTTKTVHKVINKGLKTYV